MTGGELVPKVASTVAKVGLSEDPEVNRALLEAARGAPEFSQAGRIRAARAERRQAAMYQICRPLYALVGVRKNYFEKHFEEDLAAKTKNIPEENLQTPAGSVAGPALEGLAWSLDEEALKDMYLTLLASAADDRRNETHPAFAHAIRQLSPAEAQTLQVVLTDSAPNVVMVKIHYNAVPSESRASGYVEGHRHILPLESDDEIRVDQAAVTTWVENWERLGLVEATYTASRAQAPNGPDPYEWAEQVPCVVAARLQYANNEEQTVSVKRGLLNITETGRRFAQTVFAWPGLIGVASTDVVFDPPVEQRGVEM